MLHVSYRNDDRICELRISNSLGAVQDGISGSPHDHEKMARECHPSKTKCEGGAQDGSEGPKNFSQWDFACFLACQKEADVKGIMLSTSNGWRSICVKACFLPCCSRPSGPWCTTRIAVHCIAHHAECWDVTYHLEHLRSKEPQSWVSDACAGHSHAYSGSGLQGSSHTFPVSSRPRRAPTSWQGMRVM